MKTIFAIALTLASSLAYAERIHCSGADESYKGSISVSDIENGDGSIMRYVVKINKANPQSNEAVIDKAFDGSRLSYGRGIVGVKAEENINSLRIIFDGSRAVLEFETTSEKPHQLPVSCQEE